MRGARPQFDVMKVLQNKGFNKSDTHHKKIIYYTIAGKKTRVFTKISRGTSHKDLTANNLHLMAKQCYLSNIEFDDFLDCPLSREQYEKKLIFNSVIISA